LGIYARLFSRGTFAAYFQKGSNMRPRIVLALAGVLIVALAVTCFADTQERVAPPQDQDRMHLSVVGISGSADYQRILAWFQNDEYLSSLRRVTHFHPIAAGSAMYQERYAPNIHGLPTIRLQDAKGVVLYESYGDGIPKTADALADTIEPKTGRRGLLPWNREKDCPCVLPWREKMEQQCEPQQTVVTPEDLMMDETPLPMPEIPEPEDTGLPAWLCAVLAVVAGLGGFGGAVIGSIKREMSA